MSSVRCTPGLLHSFINRNVSRSAVVDIEVESTRKKLAAYCFACNNSTSCPNSSYTTYYISEAKRILDSKTN